MGTGTTTIGGTVTLATNARLQGLAISTGASAALVGMGGITGVDVTQTALTTTTGTPLTLNSNATPGQTVDISSEAAGTSTMCANVSGNVLSPNTITLTQTGTFRVQ